MYIHRIRQSFSDRMRDVSTARLIALAPYRHLRETSSPYRLRMATGGAVLMHCQWKVVWCFVVAVSLGQKTGCG